MGDPSQPPIWRLTDHFLPVQQLPRWLYYVRHADSLTSFAPNGDIFTNHPVRELFISSRDHLDALVRQHVDWQSRGISHFISAFLNKWTACHWGRQRNPMRVVYTIDSRKLPKGWPVVYAAVHTHNPYDAEFVFLTYIPYAAIIDIHTIHSPPPDPDLRAPFATASSSVPLIPVTPHPVPPPPYEEAYPPLLGNRVAPMPAPAPTPPPIRSLPSYNDEFPPLPSRRITPPPVPAPSPPPVRSPPSYDAPQHFASPPYTTPGRYITSIPPTGTPPRAPPAAETGAYAQSDPGNPRAPEQESSTAPSVTSPPHTSPGHTPGYITPGQIMSGQNTPAVPVRFPPPALPQPMDDTAAPEPQGFSVTEPPMASDAGAAGPSVEAGLVNEPEPEPAPEAADSELSAHSPNREHKHAKRPPKGGVEPKPETPVDNPQRSAQSQPETSVDKPETPVQSNPETAVPGAGGVNINFLVEASDGEKSDSQNPGISNSPSSTRAVESKPGSPAPSGSNMNFFAED